MEKEQCGWSKELSSHLSIGCTRVVKKGVGVPDGEQQEEINYGGECYSKAARSSTNDIKFQFVILDYDE
ncbi:hypothetical protein TNCV_4636591 [Trichonephila clavipes]|nr:hypothetical protein TNCV_4636591 [Trichonephila clavipes]